MVIIMSYSFSTLKVGQLFHRAGSRADCYIYITSITDSVHVFNCWTEYVGGGFKKIDFETFSRNYWNDNAKLYYKIDKKNNKNLVQMLCRKAIQSIFTYKEYFFNNNKSWGS